MAIVPSVSTGGLPPLRCRGCAASARQCRCRRRARCGGLDHQEDAVEQRFGSELLASPVQWLSDNGSAYTAEQTRAFARQIGLLPLTTPVCSPQSNGMAESFVKTMKRDYIRHMPKPDRATALRNLAIAFEHYNEEHPHRALNYRSPREFRRLAEVST